MGKPFDQICDKLTDELDSLFRRYGFYIDFLGGQLIDDGYWTIRIKKVQKKKRQVDKTKKSNIKCEHCEYYTSWRENRPADAMYSGDCCNPDSPNMAGCVNYWNRCKAFEWRKDL